MISETGSYEAGLRQHYAGVRERLGMGRRRAPTEPAAPLTPHQATAHIIAEVAAEHGVRVADIIGHCRVPRLVRARHEAMYRVRHERPHLTTPCSRSSSTVTIRPCWLASRSTNCASVGKRADGRRAPTRRGEAQGEPNR